MDCRFPLIHKPEAPAFSVRVTSTDYPILRSKTIVRPRWALASLLPLSRVAPSPSRFLRSKVVHGCLLRRSEAHRRPRALYRWSLLSPSTVLQAPTTIRLLPFHSQAPVSAQSCLLLRRSTSARRHSPKRALLKCCHFQIKG